MKIREATEHEIQNMIISVLTMKGFYVMRLNSGKMTNEYTNKQGVVKKRFIRMLDAGTPDLLAIKKGKAHFIEIKRPGNNPTYLQQEKMKELSEYGAICIVARNVEDIEVLYK